MESILSVNPEIDIFRLNEDKKIARAKIIKSDKHEISVALINGIEELKTGDSIQCRFKYKKRNVRFNAKVKTPNSFFLIGELIFDNEKNYLRVDDDIKLIYKKLNLSEVERYINEVFNSKDDFVSLTSLLDRKDPYFKVIEYLISRIDELNETISNLSDIIQNNKNDIFEELFVNISASGMKIKKREKVKTGDILYIEMKIELSMRYHIIKLIGEVIRVENDYFIVEYRMISNKSKELIIRYSLQKDRENILKKK